MQRDPRSSALSKESFEVSCSFIFALNFRQNIAQYQKAACEKNEKILLVDRRNSFKKREEKKDSIRLISKYVNSSRLQILVSANMYNSF